MVAVGCLTTLKRRDIAVPVQISVVGFDDIAAAHYVDPPLTTIRVPMRKMGIMGMKQLIRAMSAADPLEHLRWLPHGLVVRASSGPPPGERPTGAGIPRESA